MKKRYLIIFSCLLLSAMLVNAIPAAGIFANAIHASGAIDPEAQPAPDPLPQEAPPEDPDPENPSGENPLQKPSAQVPNGDAESPVKPQGDASDSPEAEGDSLKAVIASPQKFTISAAPGAGAFSENVNFKAKLMSDEESDFRASVEKELASMNDDRSDNGSEVEAPGLKNEAEILIFNLYFTDESGELVKPVENVEITIEGEELKDKEACLVFHQTMDSGVESIQLAENGYDSESGTLCFQTSSFSLFAVVVQAPPTPVVNAIYLDGVRGDDNNDGTKTNPVQTFEKAKSIAAENKSIETIFVSGMVTVGEDSETMSLSGTGPILKRDPDFEDMDAYPMLYVADGQRLTLKNIVIDGGSNDTNEMPMVYVGEGSSLIVEGGTELRNNIAIGSQSAAIYAPSPGSQITINGGKIYNNKSVFGAIGIGPDSGGSTEPGTYTLTIAGGEIYNNAAIPLGYFIGEGGAINATRSTVNITGGAIHDNQGVRGGALYLSGCSTTMGGGDIWNNAAKNSANEKGKGGGLYICSDEDFPSDFTLTGGTISGNHSADEGGGIYLSHAGTEFQFLMQGGEISQNTSVNSGGGLFVEVDTDAHITAGSIVNNTCERTDGFGGGGIYVNGSNIDVYNNGHLYLTNAVITGNTARGEGGALAACPVSNTEIYVTDGGILANNASQADPSSQEILISADNTEITNEWHKGQPTLSLSDQMLGGALYHWLENGKEIPRDQYKDLKLSDGQKIRLKCGNTQDDIEALGESLGRVFITGNTSYGRGGGIGSNGDITIGREGTAEVLIQKSWEEGMEPREVTVQLRGHLDSADWLIEEVKLNESNGYQVKIEDLPTSILGIPLNEVVYVTEPGVASADVDISGPTDLVYGDEGTVQKFTITVLNKKPTAPTEPLKTEIRVIKHWNDDDNRDGLRPNSVSFKLLADGEDTGQRLILSADNHWLGYFTDLPTYDEEDGHRIVYTIEEALPEGYTNQIKGNSWSGFDVTNTRVTKPIDIEGQKTWQDNDNESGKRPDSITIRLLKNGVEIDSRTVTKANDWSWSFKDLPQMEDGKLITYSIVEDRVDGYRSEVQGYDVINSLETESTTEATTTTEPTTQEPTTGPSATEPTTSETITEPTTSQTEGPVPTPPTSPTTAPGPGMTQTGETMDSLYYALMGLAAAALLIVLRRKVKEN